MAFTIKIAPSAREELARIRAFDRGAIAEAIDHQLTHEPTVATRNRKMLPDLVPPFFCEPPVWEIRVGDFRVYYDVDDEVVNIRAIRTKPPHQTTEQVL